MAENSSSTSIPNQPDSQEQQQQQQQPPPRSNRPGQAGFAERYMASQGWKKGEGLGASGSGIVNPLRVQVEKRKQRSDAEGGGFVGPGGKGKIIGGGVKKKKKKKTTTKSTEGGSVEEEDAEGEEEHGKFGPMSEVVVARGMLVGMDVDAEIGNGLLQELGEECEAKVCYRFLFHFSPSRFCLDFYFDYQSKIATSLIFNSLDSNSCTIVRPSRPRLHQPRKFRGGAARLFPLHDCFICSTGMLSNSHFLDEVILF